MPNDISPICRGYQSRYHAKSHSSIFFVYSTQSFLQFGTIDLALRPGVKLV